MTYDWADLEALAEVDALTPACAPIYPKAYEHRKHPDTTIVALDRFVQGMDKLGSAFLLVNSSQARLRDALMQVNSKVLFDPHLLANAANRE